MKAAVYRKFGGPDVVRIEDVPKPVPQRGEVLIKVRASTVSIADYRARSLDLPKGLWIFGPLVLGVFSPRRKILGMDLAGTIEAVGEGVARFRPGDEVIAMPGGAYGCHAEYRCMAETAAIALKPRNMDFEDAVTLVFGGQPALTFLRRARIKAGDAVLVNGASGAVGTAAVQIARHFGAVVTAVCSGGNADLVRSLGADRVIDYTRDDFATAGETYDIVIDCVGNAPFERVGSILRPGGALLLVISDLRGMLGARRNSKSSGRLVTAAPVTPRAEDLAFLVDLAEAGEFRPVIEARYDFADIVEAHRAVDTGRKRGHLVVSIPGRT